MRMLGLIAFAALAFASLPASAGDPGSGFVQPVAAAAAFPDVGGTCLSAAAGIEALGALKREHPDTRAVAFIKGAQQQLADAWRGMMHVQSQRVDLMLAWLAGDAVAVSEFGPDGCLVTATIMSLDQWNAIVAVLRHSRST